MKVDGGDREATPKMGKLTCEYKIVDGMKNILASI